MRAPPCQKPLEFGVVKDTDNLENLKMLDLRSRLIFGFAVAVTFVAVQTAWASPTAQFKGKRTSITLSDDFLGAATALNLTLGRVKPGRVKGAVATFPIPIAEVDAENAAGEIIHSGGLSIATDAVTVELTQFIIDTTGTPVITGLVKADGSVVSRIELFDVQLPELTLPLTKVNRVTIPGATLTLTDTAAATLNSVFSVSAFAEGLSIGSATIRLQKRGSRR